jgi:hypothetical protein
VSVSSLWLSKSRNSNFAVKPAHSLISVVVPFRNKNYTHVLVSRFFLGVFESSVTPGMSRTFS